MFYVSIWRENWEASEERFDSKASALRYCRQQVAAGYKNEERGEVQNEAGDTLARYVNENGKAIQVNV